MKVTNNCINNNDNKLHLSANGSILLPLALKWSLFGLMALFIMLLTGTNKVSAASITLELPENLSLTVQPDGNLHHKESGAIKITSDAYAGYSFSMKSSDGTNTLKNSDKSKYIASIDTSSDDNNFPLNRWGFRWSGNSKSSGEYQPGPTTSTEIDKTTAANEETPNEYTITLGAQELTRMILHLWLQQMICIIPLITMVMLPMQKTFLRKTLATPPKAVI